MFFLLLKLRHISGVSALILTLKLRFFGRFKQNIAHKIACARQYRCNYSTQ